MMEEMTASLLRMKMEWPSMAMSYGRRRNLWSLQNPEEVEQDGGPEL
jgi:hypothetical protein